MLASVLAAAMTASGDPWSACQLGRPDFTSSAKKYDWLDYIQTRVGKNPGNKLIAQPSGVFWVYPGFVGNTGSYDNALPQVQVVNIENIYDIFHSVL